MTESDFDIVIVGAGVAGLSSALSALETAAALHYEPKVLIIEKSSTPDKSGGSSRYTQAYMRLKDKYHLSDYLLSDSQEFSNGRNDERYLQKLIEFTRDTIKWAENHGVEFVLSQTAFLTLRLPRWQPSLGGIEVIEAFLSHVKSLGAQIAYGTTAWKLSLDENGNVNGIYVRDKNGISHKVTAKAIILATGGFSGNRTMLMEYIKGNADTLKSHIEDDIYHQGEGIKMAIEVGAATSGQWDSFHGEPADSRSHAVEPNVLIYQYGILVNIYGERFIDEGRATIEEQFDMTAKEIFKQPFNKAFFIGDKTVLEIPGYERGLLTDLPPITADTLDELAKKIGVNPDKLINTITEFNNAVQPGKFDPFILDGKRTKGLLIEKTNWAVKIERPPFICYPIECRVNFTFGGIKTDLEGHVLDTNGNPIPGLYAAGEMTGLYYGKYLGGTSFLRSMVFGRVAGKTAISDLLNKY